MYRNETTPKIYKTHHVRLTEEGKELDEVCFYPYSLHEVRSQWMPGQFKPDLPITGLYTWLVGGPGEDWYYD